jgi:polygalacturonase
MRPRYLALVLLASPLLAQDTRNVTEPLVPPVCTPLPAQLTATSTGLAEADEQKLDTARIQKALDHCGKGRTVALKTDGSNDAFLSGPLELRQGVTLLVDKGVTLYASRDPKVYQTGPGSCGLVNDEHAVGCKPLISVKHVSGAGIMGEGVIDGRGGAEIIGKDVSWWGLAEQAKTSGRQQVPRLIIADYADNFTVYRITLRNSPNFHISYNHGDGFTVWGLKIDTPHRDSQHMTARNTDGVDPGGSKNITITQSYIRTGDDNIAIKGGDPVSNITIAHSHFYWGHGMSIGSETNGGVSKIRVSDLSLDGTDSGIRIKSNGSRGGLVHDVIYDDVCIRNSPNPISIDTGYTANGPVQGTSLPTFRDITIRNTRISGGGKFSFNGYDHDHRVATALDNVQTTDDRQYTYSLEHADITLGPGPVNLMPLTGTDSTLHGTPSKGSPTSCQEKFVPFPASPGAPSAP